MTSSEIQYFDWALTPFNLSQKPGPSAVSLSSGFQLRPVYDKIRMDLNLRRVIFSEFKMLMCMTVCSSVVRLASFPIYFNESTFLNIKRQCMI
jgi:hypothetical protein